MSPIKLVLVGREKDGIANEAREREEEKKRRRGETKSLDRKQTNQKKNMRGNKRTK